ncbi:MAG: hypothetical protein HP497_03030 [Nitrospira sp.]|nr:hypothetical protein [Nitrospira sp.]
MDLAGILPPFAAMFSGDAIGPVQPSQFTAGIRSEIFAAILTAVHLAILPPILTPIELTILSSIFPSVKLPILTTVLAAIKLAIFAPIFLSVEPAIFTPVRPSIFLPDVISDLGHDRTVMAMPSPMALLAALAAAIHRARSTVH